MRRRVGSIVAIAGSITLMAAASAPSAHYPRIAERLGLSPVAMTAIFAVYAFTLLGALLLTGRVGDRVDRRHIVTAGAVLLVGSLGLFAASDDLGTFLAARSLQGVAAGILLPGLSAMLVDLLPPARAASWNTAGPMMGLGAGAVLAAALLDLVASPLAVVVGLLVAVLLAIGAAVWIAPASPRTRTARRAGRRRTPAARRALLRTAPAIAAGWATNGLFLALGPSLMRDAFDADDHLMQIAPIAVLAASGVASSLILARRRPRTILRYGTAALGAGTAVSLLALATGSGVTYVLATAAVGSGFGTTFMGVLRRLAPEIGMDDRAGTLSLVYVVAYVSFGIPALVAGALTPVVGLTTSMLLLGAVIVLLCVSALTADLRADRPSTVDPAVDHADPAPLVDSIRSQAHRKEAP